MAIHKEKRRNNVKINLFKMKEGIMYNQLQEILWRVHEEVIGSIFEGLKGGRCLNWEEETMDTG